MHTCSGDRRSIAKVRVLCLVGLGCLAAAGCGASLGATDHALDGNIVDGEADAAIDTVIPLGPWSAPVPVGITPVGDDDPTATGDLLELYFNRTNDIFVTKRAAVTDAWGTPTLVTQLSDPAATDTTPEITYDGLTIYLASNRGGLASLDIFVATRASRAAVFGTPVRVPELSTTKREAASSTTDNTTMVFESNRNGNNDTFLVTRASAAVPWGTPATVASIATTSSDGSPALSADGLELYFDSDRGGDNEIFLATRPTINDPFGPPAAIAELAGPTFNDSDVWISNDNRTLLFTSNRDGTLRLWQSTR